MFSRPASPASRRSSSLSNVGQVGITTTITPLYARLPVKKKSPKWSLRSKPLPVNLAYRRSLLCALLLSSLSYLVFLVATQAPTWESVKYDFEKVFYLFSFTYGLTPPRWDKLENSTLPPMPASRDFTIDYIVFENRHLAHPDDVKLLKNRHITEPYTAKQVCGLVVRLETPEQFETDILLSSEPPTPQTRTPDLHAVRVRKQATLGLGENDKYFINFGAGSLESAWIVMNYHAGIWSMQHTLPDIYDTSFLPHYYTYCKTPPISSSKLSYFAQNLSESGISCTQYYLKMQNNIISCVIVVYLCMVGSALIGTFAIVFRTVPASMVTGVLHVTSGVFVIFANCIHHTKFNRLEYDWGPCHPISHLPKELYHPEFISVHSHWPLIVSWIASPIFFIASVAWIIFTQLMTTENSKMMI
ncbi:hypothetical protein CSKR_108964 [Clonorchis sinensis]|uniref:Uncharacterized protein n=2 Tax=Clonorchis sinensis TaxID=79923 RepID=A0A3R7GE36_CLOSI|nr:hypothetical protein CSKR_108964 [Clonorchis sinensis]